MSIFNWKRYTKNKQLFASVRVEFRPTIGDLVSLLAQWAYREISKRESREEHTRSLRSGEALQLKGPSQTAFAEYVRNEYFFGGNADPFEWDGDLPGREQAWLYEWGQRTALRMWPEYGDDIRKLTWDFSDENGDL